ncbi:hypothetical protein [Streptomyces sp. MUM 2J]|uniref:hypothetical protein n=1 Tax=Streptomyces sp. MUM 2J TaxID=2791987 RepID=UPI001F04DE08|nr:hypothetical protein [Streptomyces sp. MUM 2J]MCH0563284.1 hypothetical protein [Streptomyces sp. MUM 2J]
MPRFNRPPEWQQPADRHTQLIDPVLTVRQLSRFELSIKHVVRIDHALVFSTPKGGYEAYLPPRRPSRSEIAAHRYTAVYEVDMGVHPFTGSFALPSDNDAFEFTAEVDFSWQVLDPARFVASGHRDVPEMLVGQLQQAARPVSRRFPIAGSAAAEEELLRALNSLDPLGATAGLMVTWTLRIRRDLANIEHQQRLQAIDHSATEQVHTARRGTEVDAEVDLRAREQDRLQVERALAFGRQQQELALQQAHWQHEQAMLHGTQQYQVAAQQAQYALAMQHYEAQKIEFYRAHLQQGGVQAWALHLSEHPEDTGLVMNAMRDDQLRMIQAQMELVKELLAGDNAEKFELEGPKQLALRTVSDILNQRLPGVAQNPPLIPPADDQAPGLPPGTGAPFAAPDGAATAGGHAGTPQGAQGAGTAQPPAGAAAPHGPQDAAPYGGPQSPAFPNPGTAAPAAPPLPGAAPYAPPPGMPLAPPAPPPYGTPPSGTPYGGPGVPFPQSPPGPVPGIQPPAPYTPAQPPYTPPRPASGAAAESPGAPGGPASPTAAPGGPGPYAPHHGAPAPHAAPPPANAHTAPAWQAPPGYGSIPTAPPQPSSPPAAPAQSPQQPGPQPTAQPATPAQSAQRSAPQPAAPAPAPAAPSRGASRPRPSSPGTGGQSDAPVPATDAEPAADEAEGGGAV